jgi:hypothetical protein
MTERMYREVRNATLWVVRTTPPSQRQVVANACTAVLQRLVKQAELSRRKRTAQLGQWAAEERKKRPRGFTREEQLRGATKGGKARAQALTKAQRSDAARQAVAERWRRDRERRKREKTR